MVRADPKAKSRRGTLRLAAARVLTGSGRHIPSARAQGFTIIELVAVILILAIITISLAQRTPTRASLTLTARAKQLASDLRYVQALSMNNGQRYCLTLTPSSPFSGYSLTTATSNCSTTVPHPGNLSQPVAICNGTTCMTAPALSNGYLQFDGLGQPYTASGTLLAANAVITLTDSGTTATVTVSPTTGRVTVP